LLKYFSFFLKLADSYQAINNNPKEKTWYFLPGILLFPKIFRLRRAGSYFRLNFNTVFAFKIPKNFRLRRDNFRRDLIFRRQRKVGPGFIVGCGGYC